jgi:hypothetical protein
VSDKAFVQNYIDTMESKIEISCSDLYSDAILFLNQEISKQKMLVNSKKNCLSVGFVKAMLKELV